VAQRHAARAKENSAMQRAPRSAPTDAPENKSAKEKKVAQLKRVLMRKSNVMVLTVSS
jgi:hypothetical protein